MVEIKLIPVSEFERINKEATDKYTRLSLLADMSRANTIASVKRAGSGHLGSSFSAMDIVTWLYYEEMNTATVGVDHPDRDIYFSSKGHDVPGQYSVLFSLGILPKEKFVRLRRLGGTYGHPDVSTPGMEANTGSLGMGISKGRGFAYAKRLQGNGGRVFVMTGDGELQEGQIYESLQTAVNQQLNNLTVIVDHNKLQSDKPVTEISDLGDLESKFRAFGWHVARCNGHDFSVLDQVFSELRQITDKPKIVIADTIKGRGISFMEHPTALRAGNGYYRWHAGAPDDESFQRGYEELISRTNNSLKELGINPLTLEDYPADPKVASGVSSEFVVDAYGAALVEAGAKRSDLIVLGADLTADCRLREFEKRFPERFIENGIAEQDMVSMAGGLALSGLLPVVNTFASFLSARANEQVYNNACEQTRIIYANHYAGVIPAGPGQSHQSIRDISLFGSLPNFVIVQPCNAVETHLVVDYAINEATENCVLRINIGASPQVIELPADYRLTFGCGVALTEGNDAVMFAYGPVMLNEALTAAELLSHQGFRLKVINMPWLNRVDFDWLREAIDTVPTIYVLEDHAPVGGLGDMLLNRMNDEGLLDKKVFHKFAVSGYPACGTPSEALNFHGLDGASLAKQILDRYRLKKSAARFER
jgi:transketolase